MLCSRCWHGKGVDGGEHPGAVLLETGEIPEFLYFAVRSNRKGSSCDMHIMEHLYLQPFSAQCSKMVFHLPAMQICL